MSHIPYAIFYFTIFLSVYQYVFCVGKIFKSKIDKQDDNRNDKNEYTGENYITKEDVYEFEKPSPLENNKFLEIDTIESDTSMYVDDIEKINTLKNKGILKKLQKTYAEEGFESQNLVKQIKQIVSDALHIPVNEIHLHDLNTLMAKWRSINRAKMNIKQLGIEEQYFANIKKPEKETNKSEDDLLVELPGGAVQKSSYIDVDYLIQLTK